MAETSDPRWRPGVASPYGLRLAFSLLVGAVGGCLFYALSLPLPWMLGPMCAVLAAVLAGAPVVSARRFRPPLAAVIGVTLGSSFRPDMLTRLHDWLPVTIAALLCTVMTGTLGYHYLHRVAKFDKVTAYFSGMPAGVYEMTMQGGLAGGDERRIALVQATRLALIVFCVPLIMNLVMHFGGTSGLSLARSAGGYALSDVLLLGACGGAGWPIARRLHLPNPALIGPMLLSAVAHSAGLTSTAPPYLLVSSAQVVLGASIGGQFIGTDRSLLLGSTLHSLVLVPLMTALTALVALCVYRYADGGFAPTFLALAPGGTAEMSLVALALKAEVAVVVFHQILRTVCIHLFAPIIYRISRKD